MRKARSLPGSTQVGSGLTLKQWTRLKRLARDKHKLVRSICKLGRKQNVVNTISDKLFFLA